MLVKQFFQKNYFFLMFFHAIPNKRRNIPRDFTDIAKTLEGVAKQFRFETPLGALEK